MVKRVRRLFGLLVLVVGAQSAHALTLCGNPSAQDGDPHTACGELNWIDGVWWMMAPNPDTVYLVCRGSTLGLSGMAEDCEPAGGTWVLSLASSLQPGDLLHENSGGQAYLHTWDLTLGSGGAPIGDCSQFDVGQIDLEKAGGFFSVGFFIVAMCWAIGKAVSTVLGVIRRM